MITQAQRCTPTSLLVDLLEITSRFAGKCDRESKQTFPSMSLVNDVLQDDDVSKAVMNFLMHYSLSLYQSEHHDIVKSDKADNDYKGFFNLAGATV